MSITRTLYPLAGAPFARFAFRAPCGMLLDMGRGPKLAERYETSDSPLDDAQVD